MSNGSGRFIITKRESTSMLLTAFPTSEAASSSSMCLSLHVCAWAGGCLWSPKVDGRHLLRSLSASSAGTAGHCHTCTALCVLWDQNLRPPPVGGKQFIYRVFSLVPTILACFFFFNFYHYQFVKMTPQKNNRKMKTTISPSSMLSCIYWYFSLIFCHELSSSNLQTIFFFNWHKSSIWTGLCTSSVRPPPGWFGEGWGNALPRCLKASLQCGRGALTERDQKQPVS